MESDEGGKAISFKIEGQLKEREGAEDGQFEGVMTGTISVDKTSEKRPGHWMYPVFALFVSLLVLLSLGCLEDSYRKTQVLAQEDKWSDTKNQLLLQFGEKLGHDEAKHINIPFGAEPYDKTLLPFVTSYRSVLDLLYRDDQYSQLPQSADAAKSIERETAALERRLQTIVFPDGACRTGTQADKDRCLDKRKKIRDQVKAVLQDVDRKHHRHEEIEKSKALSQFKAQIAAAVAKSLTEGLPYHESPSRKLLMDYSAALDKLFSESEQNRPSWFSRQIFDERGGWHSAYRILMAFLNLLVAISLLSVLYFVIQNSPPPLNELAAGLSNILDSAKSGSDGAAKTVGALAAATGIAAVPIYATYQALPPPASSVSESRADRSSDRPPSAGQLRLERSIAEMRTVKAELDAEIAVQRELTDGTRKVQTSTVEAITEVRKWLGSPVPRDDGLKDAAGELKIAAVNFAKGADSSFGAAVHTLQGLHLAGSQIEKVNTGLDSLREQQGKMLNKLLLPIATSHAYLLRHSVMTESADQPGICANLKYDNWHERAFSILGPDFASLSQNEKCDYYRSTVALCEIGRHEKTPLDVPCQPHGTASETQNQ